MPGFLIPGWRIDQEIFASRIWLIEEQKWIDQEVTKIYNRWIEHVTDTIRKGGCSIFEVRILNF